MSPDRRVAVRAGLPDADGEANGEQKLSGEEPRGGGDAGLNVDHLLRQDGNIDSEQDDGGSHVG